MNQMQVWRLERFAHLPLGTLGMLYREEGAPLIYTIERPWLANQPYISCIPYGTYRLRPFSGRRWTKAIEVSQVPGRTFILIHPANRPAEVQGCIAPGLEYQSDADAPRVLSSVEAMKSLMSDFEDSERAGEEVYLEIISIRGG